MKKYRLLSVLVSLALCMCAFAAVSADDQLTIAAINLQEDQFSSWCALGYQAAADAYGVKELHAISNGDLGRENELVNTYATQNVDGIAIMPASETASHQTLQ